MQAGLQFLIRIVSKSTKANSLSVKLEKPRKLRGFFVSFNHCNLSAFASLQFHVIMYTSLQIFKYLHIGI